MDWLAVEIKFGTLSAARIEQAADILASLFEQVGVQGVETRPNAVIGYLPADDRAEERTKTLLRLVEEAGMASETLPEPASIRVRRYDETDWNQAVYGALKPRRIGRRFVVSPAWEEFEAGPDDHAILLERCQAFGTGDHVTTQTCLELLEDYTPTNGLVADVGCGSGILAIAALKLGAARAVGTDNDPVAVEASQENAAANGLADRFTVAAAEGFDLPLEPDAEIDLAISNIISAVIIPLVPQAAARLKPGKLWIVSGITTGNWLGVEEALAAHGFEVLDRREVGDWVSAAARRLP